MHCNEIPRNIALLIANQVREMLVPTVTTKEQCFTHEILGADIIEHTRRLILNEVLGKREHF